MDDEGRNIATSPLVELRKQMYGEEGARPHGVSMLDRDPPDHTRLRRLMSKAFTPRAVQTLRPRIASLVDSMLDAAEREGQVWTSWSSSTCVRSAGGSASTSRSRKPRRS